MKDKKSIVKRKAPKTKESKIKITKNDQINFPYKLFPVKVIHMDGKDLLDKKTCYFQSEEYAKEYINKNNLKKNNFFMFIKELNETK